MPTYVYECKQCEKVFEVDQRITADPLTDCDCGAKDSLRRLIQPIAVMFKGGGFHINDYASKGTAAVEPNSAPAPAATPEPVAVTTSTPEPAASPAVTTAPKSD